MYSNYFIIENIYILDVVESRMKGLSGVVESLVELLLFPKCILILESKEYLPRGT